MKNLFKCLESKKRNNQFKQSDEYAFYIEHRELLLNYPKFEFLYNSDNDEFNVFRANVIINGFLNKILLEEEISTISKYSDNINIDRIKFLNLIKEKLIDAPYYLDTKEKIYIPFFSRALNNIYIHEPEKILKEPYDKLKTSFSEVLVDPFDTYGAKIFDSYFTRLINVGTNGKEIAYFHYDTNTIYFVNNQGRLDHKLILFDKYLYHPNTNHMLERIKPVVDAYFANSRSDLLVSLHENNLISSHMLSLILTKRSRR